MMEGTSLLSLPEGMLVEQIQITENGLVIAVAATHPTSCCPLCSEASSSIHCHYRRVLRDAPCAGRRVQLVLTVRKFSCRNPLCERKVFAERLPALVEPWARMTIRYCEQDHLHWTGNLRQRGCPISRSFRDTNHSPNDPASHHGSARYDCWIDTVSGDRRFCVSAWLPVRHDPGGVS